MAETLDEQYEREKPRVDAELRRREAVRNALTGVNLKVGGFYIDGHRRKRGPMRETVPGVWSDGTVSYHANGVVMHSTLADPDNLTFEAVE